MGKDPLSSQLLEVMILQNRSNKDFLNGEPNLKNNRISKLQKSKETKLKSWEETQYPNIKEDALEAHAWSKENSRNSSLDRDTLKLRSNLYSWATPNMSIQSNYFEIIITFI